MCDSWRKFGILPSSWENWLEPLQTRLGRYPIRRRFPIKAYILKNLSSLVKTKKVHKYILLIQFFHFGIIKLEEIFQFTSSTEALI